MLASLNICQWSARKHDKAITNEVDKSHGAKDGGRYNKLLIDKAALEPMEKIANAARSYHYKVTLPWGDNGDRLLVAALFMDYTKEMRDFKTQFQVSVNRFITDYPQLKVDARKRLGTMYDPNDYPPNIADKFVMGWAFSPVPVANDFRVNLSADHVDAIKTDIEARMTERQVAAAKKVYERARKIVQKIAEQTSTKERRIYDSTIDNAREFVGLLPALNFTGDPELNRIGADLQILLVDPDRLRQDHVLRQSTAKQAEALLARM